MHIDPDTGEIMYVGSGTGGRAWQIGYNKEGKFRSAAHRKWIDSHIEQGRTMGDLVKIIKTNLTLKEARELEYKLTKEIEPPFDRLVVPYQKKTFTKEQAKMAYQMYTSGVGYTELARQLKMTQGKRNLSVLGKRMVEAGAKLR
jgi:hypothetical protein